MRNGKLKIGYLKLYLFNNWQTFEKAIGYLFMNDIFFWIIYLGFIVTFFSFGIAIYMNLWIYYSANKSKYPLFPILNPLSFSSYELVLNSMVKMNWKVEGENKKLKLKSNKLRKFSGKILLIIIGIAILNLILT